jgi:hypothetical protein
LVQAPEAGIGQEEQLSRIVCFYKIDKDTGFAPNPDFNVCTLAACTPNHMRGKLKLREGDFIAGCFPDDHQPQIAYVMKIDEILTLDEYCRDPRFEAKKPSRQYLEGDNIYYRADDEEHRQDPSAHFHRSVESQCQDVKGNKVFVGRDFIYLGRKCTILPRQFTPWLPYGQGIKYLREDDEPELFDEFLTWWPNIEGGRKGKLGTPRNPEPPDAESGGCGCTRSPEPKRPRSCRS